MQFQFHVEYLQKWPFMLNIDMNGGQKRLFDYEKECSDADRPEATRG